MNKQLSKLLVESSPESIHVVTLENVQETSVRWLWKGWIPYAKITVVDGDPALGKSTLLLDLAARVSTGRPMPDGSPGECGGVLLLSAEDGPADTIKPRLRAAEADLHHIHLLDSVDQGPSKRPPALPEDVNKLRQAIREYEIRLVIIDPFVAYLSSQVDSARDQHVRRALHRLGDLAEETGVAVVLVRHLNKGNSPNPLYRGGGSIGIIGAARAGLVIGKSPDDPDRRVLAANKSNLARPPDSWAFRLRETPAECCNIDWLGPVKTTAAELTQASAGPGGNGKRDEAVQFLVQYLLSHGRSPAEEVYRAARQEGIADRTLKRGKQVLGLVAKKIGQQWYWSLRPDSSTIAAGAAPVVPCDPSAPGAQPWPTTWKHLGIDDHQG